jgi:A/G-specific adenine glycosylase
MFRFLYYSNKLDMPLPDAVFFAQSLLQWYARHKRPLPWRETKDPYAIWLSEVILQQTRVSQGLPYYLDFINTYPTVLALALAPEEEVLRHWQGLGYYSRARNMHHTARHIAEALQGNFPTTYQGLLKLRGIGPYTAAAIASFAYGEKVAVLDGNVFRVLARVFGLADDIASPAGKKVFQHLADACLPAQHPDTYNQAIMEFGAIQCTPNAPDCLFCPLQQHCFAFQNGLVQALPYKAKARPSRERYFHYLVFEWENQYYLKKRVHRDIWQGLYDFYLHETDTAEFSWELSGAERAPLGIQIKSRQEPVKTYKHLLTHQKILARFHRLQLAAPLSPETLAITGLVLFNAAQIEQIPKPVMIARYLKEVIF